MPRDAEDDESRRLWWGLALAKSDAYLEIVVSTTKCDGKYYPVPYDRADEEGRLRIPFDQSGQYNPYMCQMRLVEFFPFSISGPKRASQLDQRVINTVLQGAKKAFSNKKAVYTVKKYLRRHQKHSGTVSVIVLCSQPQNV